MPKYAGTGYCPSCEEEVDVYWVDEGIGAYEYWGSREVQHKWEPLCDICRSYIEDFEDRSNDDYDLAVELEMERRRCP